MAYPRGTKEGLPEAQRASQGSQRRNPSAIGDPRGPNSRRPVPSRNAPRRTPVSTRVTGTRPFTLRSAKRSGLKRVVRYPCYAFKVCVGLAGWGRGRARTRTCYAAAVGVGGGHLVEGQALSGATKDG